MQQAIEKIKFINISVKQNSHFINSLTVELFTVNKDKVIR